MAHQLENFDDMFYVGRDTPWHGMGTQLINAPTSVDAIRYANLDWEVTQKTLYVPMKEERFSTPLFAPTNYLANVRQDTGDVLGVVTSRYVVVQNEEAFSFADSLVANEKDVHYETAGCLLGGKKIWLLARLPECYVLDDQVDCYLVYTHGHDGRSPIYAAITNIRVVCNNTLTFALKGATRTWTTRHIGNMEDKLEEARFQLNLVNKYNQQLNTTAEQLYQVKLSQDKIHYLTEKLFPLIGNETKRTVNGVERKRDELLHRMNAPDLENFKGTGWQFVGAVSDFESHSLPLRQTKAWREHRMINLIEGNHLMDRAIALVRAA